MSAPRSQPIRRQLFLLLLALGLPFLIFLGVSTAVHARHEREHAGQEMLALARITAARLDDHVSDITEILATLSEVVGVTPADADRNDALLARLAQRLPPHINNVTVYTIDGRNIGSIDPRMRGVLVDIRTRSFFREALAQPGLAVQAPFRSTLNGEAVGVFALRIERAGRVVGVVSMGTQLRHLQSLLAPAGAVREDAVTTVVGPDGVVLARSIDPDQWIGRNLLTMRSDVEDSMRRREGVRDGPGADGVARIAGFTTATRVPWLVHVGMPEDEAMAAAHEQLRESLVAGAVLLLLGVALSGLVARRISSPLRRLQADARAFEAGDLSRRSDVRGRGEIAMLAGTLNQMAEALQQRTRLLEDSEQQLADLYANAPCGYHSVDATGRFVRINDTGLDWLGFSRDEVVGRMRITDFLTADGRELFAREFPRLQAEDRLDNLEFDIVGRLGVPRHVIANVTVIRDARGRFEMTRTALHDISELHRARQALARVTREQRTILDTDLVGILRLRERRVVWCNRGAERLFGFGPGEFTGRSTRAYFADDASYEQLGAASAAVLSTGHAFRAQVQLMHASGALLWIDISATATHGEPGEVLCLMVDVTERRNAEDARLRSLALESENRQLREASRFKDLFLSNMSHELRTPLNAVVGYTHLLRTGLVKPGTPEHAAHLDKVGQGAAQLQHMIGAMLDFAKADAEAIEFHPRAVDVSRVVQVVLDTQGGAIRDKDIDVVCDVDPALGDVVVDELRLTQVLSAYVSNAVKFSRSGGLVEIRAGADGPADFRIDVEDHGNGIAPTELARLFTAFQPLGEAGTRVHAGAGIGLALSRKLVEAQGGRVGVESRLAFGSTFHLVLPLEPA